MAVQKVYLLNQTTPVNIPSGLVPKGAYDAGTDYAVGDSVDYNGSSYVMYVDAAAGTLPTDTTKWQVLANKGDTGETATNHALLNNLAYADSGHTGFEPAKGADDNYVTDAEKVVIGNTSGTNTGDQDLSAYQLEPSEGAFVDGDKTKLDGIEALADVTDATNVAAAGAIMDGDITGNGLVTRTGAGAYTNRTITGTSNQVTVSNGNGVSGNPTLSLPQNIDTSATPTFSSLTAGTATDVLGTALSVIRNNVAVGRIDNNASGLRVQAQNGSLQLRGTGNTGIAIDASGNAVVAGTITGANLSGTNTGDQPLGSRTITGTTNQVTVTNGNGVSGNPTLSLPSAITTPGSLTITGNNSPQADSTYTLGTSALYWSNTYTDRLYLNSTAYLDGGTAGAIGITGLVGIGTTSPTNPLHVAINAVTNSPIIQAQNINTGGGAVIGIDRANNPRVAGLQYSTAGSINWVTGMVYNAGVAENGYSISTDATLANTKLYVSTAGNVGIGTTSPSAKLQVDTSAATTIGQIIKGASAQTADYLQIRTSGATAGDILAVKSSGRVGIGVSDPQAALEIAGDIETTIGANRKLKLSSATAYWYDLQSTNDDFQIIEASDVNKVRLTIKYPNGNVGIGTGSPTHTLTLPSTSTGIALYRTSDQTTNFDRVRTYWNSTVYTILTEKGGTGTARNISIGGTGLVTVQPDGVFLPVQAVTASAPTYIKGGVYFDTTLNKLRVGGATAWETITSV